MNKLWQRLAFVGSFVIIANCLNYGAWLFITYGLTMEEIHWSARTAAVVVVALVNAGFIGLALSALRQMDEEDAQ